MTETARFDAKTQQHTYVAKVNLASVSPWSLVYPISKTLMPAFSCASS